MGEPTTIDNLQIEIQSNSTNAASGIDALATSLGNLKKQTISKTAIKNLSEFSNVVKNMGNVHGASNALRTLANSIEKLKSVGTLSSLNKSLNALPTALNTLKKVDLEGVAAKTREVANAFAPLSSMKAGGLGTMLRNLSKLEDVTNSLDETKIKNFAIQVKKVADALGPLSAKMATVKEGFRGLNTVVKQADRSLAQMNEEVNTGLFNFSNFSNVMSSVVGVIQQVAQGFANIMNGAMQWDGVKYQFGNAFGEQADMYYEKITEMTDALRINKQEFMENSAMGASMLIGFGVDKEDAREMGVGYTQLAYDIWAAYNNVYKSLSGADGAMAAIRSAIAGEVEPIRRAGFTIIESQLEQTAANHGLAISLETATEAQKSYLRYLELTDQAQAKGVVGSYRREMETAEGLTRTLTQQLKSLGQAFGSLFIPMLVKALPYVQAFVELLTEGVHWLASLFGIEIQDISGTWNDYSSNVDTAVGNTENITGALNDAEKAAKALKNASIGIDELNVISPSSASNGGDGSGGSGDGAGGAGGFGDINSLWDQSIWDGVQSQVDGIKTKLKGMFDEWLPELKIVSAALAGLGITKLLDHFGDAIRLSDDFKGKVDTLRKALGTAIIVTLQFSITKDAFEKFMGEGGTLWDYMIGVATAAIGTYLLKAQWGAGGLILGLGITAVASLSAVMEEGGVTDVESLTVALTGLASAIGAIAIAWGKLKDSKFLGEMSAFFALAKEGGIVATLAAAFPKLSTALSGFGTAISGAFSSVGTFFAGLSGGVIATAAAAFVVVLGSIASVVYFVKENVDELKKAFNEFFQERIAPQLEEIKGHFDKMKEAFSPVTVAFREIGKGIKEVASSIWDFLKPAFEWFGGFNFAAMTTGLMGVFSSLTALAENIVQILSGTIQQIGGWFDVIVGIFTLDGDRIIEGTKKIGKGIVDVWVGLAGLVIEPVVELYNGVVGWFTKLWDILVGHSIVPDTVNAIIEWFTSLPSKILGSIESFANGVVKKFQDMWKNLTSWWNSKPKLSEYTPSIGDIKAKLSSAWTSAKNWWDKTKSNLASYTPSIGNIAGKLKTAWESAKSWWSKSRSNLSYTPSIGSISSKLSSAWTTAKNWWNKSRSSLSYTPSIGSIKDKIVSAWNTAKSWWNKNVGGLSTKLNISIPKISIKWDTVSALGKEFRYPTGFKLSYAAQGGIFDQGSLVWAGERGPEIVANAAGGKTGVMNVEQMQDAVYEGVFAAITAAMSGKSEGGAQAVNVYLDGRQITAAVEQRQRERGASIMGSGVYSY